jgi:hypothetical protein
MYVCDNPENGVVTPLASATVSGGAFLAAPHASSSQAKDLGGGISSRPGRITLGLGVALLYLSGVPPSYRPLPCSVLNEGTNHCL